MASLLEDVAEWEEREGPLAVVDDGQTQRFVEGLDASDALISRDEGPENVEA